MELAKLYEIAEKEHIPVFNWYIEDCDGCYINTDELNAIALNYDNFGTYIDEKLVLAEELGHYYQNATYPINCKNYNLISKQEYRAKKWSYNVLIPYNKLKEAVSNGITLLWDLADYFEVTCQYMQECIDFYTNKYGYIL